MEKAPFVTENEKKAFWHATSHVLADAVKRLWPDVKLGIGPAIDEGFYYDFDKKVPFTAEDLVRIEAEMKKIVKDDKLFKDVLMPRKDAEKFLSKEPYKLELLKDITDKEISFRQHGAFIDLCNNTLLKSAGQIKAFKLLNMAAAYWRGDPKKGQMQRIYGISFPEKEMLEEFMKRKEEAEKRDHIKLGKQLDLFGLYPETVGSGLAHWHPKGAITRNIIENFWKSEHEKKGYKYVYTPHIGNINLWKTSGHWAHYRESMYPPIKIDEIEYLLKPMSCPFHIQIFKSKSRSYRELPLKLCELGTVYRYEASGALHGLVRVRGFTQDDAHIFCTQEQLEGEITNVLDLALFMLPSFGFKEYVIELSVRDPENKEKYLGSEKIWETAEKALTKALEKKKLQFKRAEGEAKFYGPAIDIKLKDAIGRTWQCTTIQVDFNLPEKFDLNYVSEDNKQHRVIMVHHTVLGSMERFMGCLIEHYAGAFPVWLAPAQVKLLTFTDRNQKYAEKIEAELKKAGLRVETDYENNTVEYKVRAAEMEKIPYVLVLGDKEEEKGTVAVRKRGTQKVQFGVKPADFIKQIKEEIEKKA